ncbi:MAG: hypothetical protein VX712_09680 [Bacteroidota bacterium]|uniref:Uncharacterized protein n=1 Tax=Christiangramia flava JLT2011 TaxID=1229726 RepID=A0A1L7I7L4_9FLAO|nr:hypothetical protein [Christiangramia flava]APU69608.1 hypothetical protein GRFL_2884 [Christiangramia flava JLT2011]MEE2772475.1 hypothetical protein [Bacteroidota bacterium]OSS39361.1 hypothetical protein C723_1907 [Christiangramia flava JLT2011]
MTKEPIRFKKERELGEILSATFKFLRENYKALFGVLLKTTGPALALLLLSLAFYSFQTVGSIGVQSMFSGGTALLATAILLITYLVYYAALTGTIYHSIRSYISHEGQIIPQEVYSGVKSDFGNLLAISVISGLLVFFGFLLLLIPGIYVAVPLSLAPAIIVFRNKSVFDAISDCFELVKNNWWATFGSIIVISIIVYIVGLVFQIPTIIYFIIKTMTVFQEGTLADPSSMFDTGYIIMNIISSMIQYIIYGITPIGFAFVYFHLNEKKHFTGTYETIQNLGKKD